MSSLPFLLLVPAVELSPLGTQQSSLQGRPPLASGDYSLTIPFSSTTSDYTFCMTNVYAPSNHDETEAFLSELRAIQPAPNQPWMAIGDYNLTRSPADKNNANFNWSLANSFNGLIGDLALIELPLLDRL